MPDKQITGWLIVNWKSGQHRTRQSKPSAGDLGKNELVAKVAIDVTIPKPDVPELALAIDVPEPQVHAATLEALDDDALPDWSNVAAEAIAAHEDDFTASDLTVSEWERTVDVVTMATLRDVQGRPNVDRVREYVEQLAADTYGTA